MKVMLYKVEKQQQQHFQSPVISTMQKTTEHDHKNRIKCEKQNVTKK